MTDILLIVLVSSVVTGFFSVIGLLCDIRDELKAARAPKVNVHYATSREPPQ